MSNDIDYAIAVLEINNDPTARGYAAPLADGNHAEIARLMNQTISASETGIPEAERTIEVASISKQDAQQAVVAADYAALASAEKRDLWLAILQLDPIPVKNTNIRAQIAEVWGAGTSTRDSLVALQSRPASRTEVRFGEGKKITARQIGEALSGT